MEWENPLQSFLLFILFIYTTLYINAEYAFCCPIFIILTLFTKSYIDRKAGRFQKYWIENEYAALSNNERHEPLAIMRLAVVGFRNIPSLLPIDSNQGTRSMRESAVAGHAQRKNKEDDGLPILKNGDRLGSNVKEREGNPFGEGGRDERNEEDYITDIHLSNSIPSTPRNVLHHKSASLPYVKVTYQPMSSADIERIESRFLESNKEEEGVNENELGINNDDGEGYEREEIRERERKNKERKDEKEKLERKKREFIVGCLCLQKRTPAAVNESSFSQLVASLNLGLSRTENQTSDSVLQNILDPWIRSKNVNNGNDNNTNNNSNNNYNNYDRNNYGDDNYDNHRNNSDSPSTPYLLHTQQKDDDEENSKSRLRQNSKNSNSNSRFSSSSDIKKKGEGEAEQQIDISLLYPVLQPQTKIPIFPISTTQSPSSNMNNLNVSKNQEKQKQQNNQKSQKLNMKKKTKLKGPYFLPWERNEGLLKLSMFVDDPSSFLGSPWGFAKIQIKDFLPGYGVNTGGTYVFMKNRISTRVLSLQWWH